MRHTPRAKYSGLTIVLSNPSRFDRQELISGRAGHYFLQECLYPCGITRLNCDIRTADTLGDSLLPSTNRLLLLGEKAFKSWSLAGRYTNYSLGEQRGSPLESRFGGDVITIASYSPQDAMDIIDFEAKLNPLAQGDYESDDTDDDSLMEVKTKGRTRRSNFRFWLKQDVKKLLTKPFFTPKFEARIAPPSAEIKAFLNSLKNENLYIDIETDILGCYNLFCIGIANDTSPVYVIPVFRAINNILHYHDMPDIFKSLAIAFSRNTVIAHNGFAFDLPILAWRYRIPFGRRNYDTMIAHHRCFPEVEKSLGHCMSIWTWEEYHKDEGIFNPRDVGQEQTLWKYNARDVHGMRLVKQEIDNYAKKVPGLVESIRQGNDCIYPYTLCSLTGIGFSDDERVKIIAYNDRVMNQLLRMINICLKLLDYKEILLPTSSPSCVKFFHAFLGYEVVARSKRISKRTGQPLNTPSLNEAAMLKLKLLYPKNVLIDICLKYRQVKKETSLLKFIPWNINEPPS